MVFPLLYLTTFYYSVEHRYGEEFWKEIGVGYQDYKKYEFDQKTNLDNAQLEISPIPIKHPHRRHQFAFYIKINK